MSSRLGELLESTLRRAGLDAPSAICQIAERWKEIVGPRIASRATPVRLVGDELTLAAADPVWRQELTLLGPDIAGRVNQNLENRVVRRVKLVTGEVRPPDPGPARRRLIPIETSDAPEDRLVSSRSPSNESSDNTEIDVAAALTNLANARRSRLLADRRERESRGKRERRIQPGATLLPWNKRGVRRFTTPRKRKP